MFYRKKVKIEAAEEWMLMRRLLFEIRHDQDLPAKIKELLPILRFADRRYAATHPDQVFVPLEALAKEMLRRHPVLDDLDDDDMFFFHGRS